MEETQNLPTKRCKICHAEKPVTHFAPNPHAKDGSLRNSVCGTREHPGCYGRSKDTDRGRARAARERKEDHGSLQLVEELFDAFKTGDVAKDFFIKQLLKVALTAKNEQAQLQAMKMLAEFKGLDKETPQSEADLIQAAFSRIEKQKQDEAPTNSN